jgi:hypothetical protein
MLMQRFPDVVSAVTDCCETRETRGLYGRWAIVSDCNAGSPFGPATGRGQNSRHGAIAAAPTILQPLRLPATRPVLQLARLPDTWPYLLPGGLAKGGASPYL